MQHVWKLLDRRELQLHIHGLHEQEKSWYTVNHCNGNVCVC